MIYSTRINELISDRKTILDEGKSLAQSIVSINAKRSNSKVDQKILKETATSTERPESNRNQTSGKSTKRQEDKIRVNAIS